MANRYLRQSLDALRHLDEEELDAVRALLVQILMKNTSLEREEIYSDIFGEGKRIFWH